MFEDLASCGWALLRSGGRDPTAKIVASFARNDVNPTRDVTIGQRPTDPLRPQPGDFWFHTDGVFWTVPPRWVAIQLLEADKGGELQVLDSRWFVDEVPVGTCLFGGREPRNRAAISWERGGVRAIRYRQDYMTDGEPASMLSLVDALVRRWAAEAVDVPDLEPLDCLIVDNWTHLHRRKQFEGERRVRRIWFEGNE